MKNFLFLTLVVIFNYFVINVLAENEYYLVSIKAKSNVEYDKASKKVQKKIDELVNDRMNDIYDVIVDNQEDYGKNDEKLEEITETSKLRKRREKSKFQFINRNRGVKPEDEENGKKHKLESRGVEEDLIPIESKLVIHVCPVADYYVVIAYLPETLVKEVEQLPNVISCRKAGKLKKASKYYNEKEILKDTKWKGVTVQENDFDFELRNAHLSMMSQGKYHINSTHPYDNNYYYPSTAGKGIDIYVIDDGLDASLSEENFDTYAGTPDERVVKCDGIFFDGQIHTVSTERRCLIEYNGVDVAAGSFNHGTSVAISAMGALNGVAKKANLHSLAIEYYTYDVLAAFDYIKQVGKPHKSVVNISSGLFEDEAEFSLKEVQDKIKELNEYGIIIIVSAGNDSKNCCKGHSDVDRIYGAVEGVVKVGALNNRRLSEYGNMETMYEIASYSNYGSCVDIFSPGTVRVTNKKNEIIMTTSGTSFASPFVAGLAATIMAEHDDIEFDFETLRAKLIELSVKDVIRGLDKITPNRLASNGKHSVYGGERCDAASGEHKCKDQCCTKSGVCADPKVSANVSMCLVENGCQSEFGVCGKTVAAKKCGKDSKCADDECCSKDGTCVKAGNKLCLIENGCKSEFGNCSTNKCGKKNGNRKCGDDECCSKEGVCVNIFKGDASKCFLEKGCMRKYSGQCFTYSSLLMNLYDKKYHDVIRTYRCIRDLEKYEKCDLNPYIHERDYYDLTKRNDICKAYERNKCQKITSNPERYFSGCKKDGKWEMVERFINSIKYVDIYCSKRNPKAKDDYCVVNNDKMYAVYGALSEVIIDDLCPYEQCRESYLNILKSDYDVMKQTVEVKPSLDDKTFRTMKIYEKAIKLMTQKKCSALAELDFYSAYQ